MVAAHPCIRVKANIQFSKTKPVTGKQAICAGAELVNCKYYFLTDPKCKKKTRRISDFAKPMFSVD
jgi:hypothetical protein